MGFALALADASGAEGSAPATPPGEALAEAGGLGERLARLAASALAACAVVQLVAPGATFIASLPADALRPPAGRPRRRPLGLAPRAGVQ